MSGGANCPETPRQKMIGMMYLFLTAMLALNVSKDILNAFVVVNNGLEETNTNFDNKIKSTINEIEFAYEQDKVKVKDTYDASQIITKEADKLVDYINVLKKEVINLTEGQELEAMYGDTVQLINVGGKDNYDAPTRYFMGGSTTNGEETAEVVGGKAPELRGELRGFITDITTALKKAKVQGVDQMGDFGVNTEDPEHKDPEHPEENYWASSKFYHLPLAATVAILTQTQNQVRNAEATALNSLLGNIGKTDLKFDRLQARVVPKSTYVVQGGDYEADLFVAAWSSTTNPTVIVGPANALDTNTWTFKNPSDTMHVPVEDGIGKYRVKASSLGEKKYASVIQVKNTSTGVVTNYPLQVQGDNYASYMVAKPSAVISPTKMNVFYIGVDNPVSISVPGFATENISATMNGGRISAKNKARGEYIVKVSKRGKAVVKVTGKDENGKTVSLGSQEFRVKKVPPPVAKIAGKNSGSITKNKLLAAGGVQAAMDKFDFELKATVVSYTLSMRVGQYDKDIPVKGYSFRSVEKDLKKLKRGTRITLVDIIAKVAGSIEKLQPISLKIKYYLKKYKI
jgi:gliding motility-associated protein GldM